MAASVIPPAVQAFFSKFPLYTYPSEHVVHTTSVTKDHRASLWIAPPRNADADSTTNGISADVECLKWQAYIALKGVDGVHVRWDISPDGAVDGRLPSLLTFDGEGGKPEVLGARALPAWVDRVLRVEEDVLEGYVNAATKDESRAWVALLEGVVHSALMLSNPKPITFKSLLLYKRSSETDASQNPTSNLSPPPAPLSGVTAAFPLYGSRISLTSIHSQYRDAIISLSDRLGEDTWFLGSSRPTALDALVFAYLHCLLHSPSSVRQDVASRSNLVAWERRVRKLVEDAFVS